MHTTYRILGKSDFFYNDKNNQLKPHFVRYDRMFTAKPYKQPAFLLRQLKNKLY